MTVTESPLIPCLRINESGVFAHMDARSFVVVATVHIARVC